MKKLLQWFEDLPEYVKPELTKVESFFHKILKWVYGVKAKFEGSDASGQ